ncbi:hypothetical protein [Frankia sp. AgB32]|uniref:hypothetical protein n=1 Tax=Frankia sp. AgB32 TaxID=631119 RepID=UPI00200CE8D1|nr:hypothetical protein [Frankia sp. AgB32]MCK9895223.1 hypothetical protein [Frankia sp. AgB32]
MEITALIVSIISLVVAIGSTVYARQVARIEQERRKDERIPTLVGETERVNGTWCRLRLQLTSDWPLAGIVAEIVEGDGVSFTPSQNGVEPGAQSPITTARWEALGQGDSAVWRIELAETWSTKIRLRVGCRGEDGREWSVSVEVKTPNRLTRISVPRGRLW